MFLIKCLMPSLPININGLSNEEVIVSRKKYGSNELNDETKSGLLTALLETLKEPMLILLLAAGMLYLISGSTGDAVFMLFAIVIGFCHLTLPGFAQPQRTCGFKKTFSTTHKGDEERKNFFYQ